MKYIKLISHSSIKVTRDIFVLLLLGVTACSPVSLTPPPLSPTVSQVKATSSPAPSPTTEVTQEDLSILLSEPGPYAMSRRRYAFDDPSRKNKNVSITVWYPAMPPAKASTIPMMVGTNLEPDLGDAPYPLLLSSTQMAMTFASYIVSHGFVWVSVNGIDTYPKMNAYMYSQPLDILFALDQAGANTLEGLEGVIDADRTGVLGYSFDGYNTLALSGARIDPDYYLAQCPEPDATTAKILGESSYTSYNCVPALEWETFTAGVPEGITSSEDGLWQPMTDSRIRAVMPLAGEGWWLFGEKGLAAVDIPVLMMTATQDPLYQENALIFEHLNSPEKTFISFVDLDHEMIFDTEEVARISQFMIAFFGYHLQGYTDYADYYSAEYVERFDDLAWGVVKVEN